MVTRSLATALCLLVSWVPCHSGRTDASGGHYNRKTGEYHYHGTTRSGGSTRSTRKRRTPPRPTVSVSRDASPSGAIPSRGWSPAAWVLGGLAVAGAVYGVLRRAARGQAEQQAWENGDPKALRSRTPGRWLAHVGWGCLGMIVLYLLYLVVVGGACRLLLGPPPPDPFGQGDPPSAYYPGAE